MKKIVYVLPLLAISAFTNCGSKDTNPLCFTAEESGSSIKYLISDETSSLNIDIEVSSNKKTWKDWDGSKIVLKKDEKKYVRNTKNTLSSGDKKPISHLTFAMEGKIAASGNVMSMINYADLTPYCFCELFAGCTVLTKAPDLPAATLADGCYAHMFYNCSKMNYLKVGFGEKDKQDWPSAEYSTSSWLYGVSSTGKFAWRGSKELDLKMRGENYVPQGWTVETY